MFKTILAIIAVTVPVLVNARTVNVRVGSYNLRMQQLDKGDNDWSLRHGRVIRSIIENDFDVFGVQEVNEPASEQLRSDFSDRYDCIFFNPYSQDGKGGRAQGIFYDKTKFKLVKYKYFWPSDTPFEVSFNDHVSSAEKLAKGLKHYCRGGMFVILKVKGTGKKLFFMNTHSALNLDDNQKYAHVYVDMEKEFNPHGYPSFFVGDFNARPDNPSHEVYRKWWSDCWDGFPDQLGASFNAFNTDPSKWEYERRIDFIYYRNVSAPVSFVCNRSLYDGFLASDHFPLRADFKL